jgi:hypothetical protein
LAKTGKNCPLTPRSGVGRVATILGGLENQFTLTRAALSTSGGAKSEFLSFDAVFKFKRYEDSSLSYTGIVKHDPKDIGGYDTVITAKEFQESFVNRPAAAK